jgi:hypothetical protein
MNPQNERTTQTDAVDDRRSLRRARRIGIGSSSISGGVFLIGLGMLALTGWWWPGIMLVIGLAAAAELARRGQMAAAAGTFLSFAAIPLGIALVSAIGVPWLSVGAFILIALGLLALARAAVAEEAATR